MSASLNMTYNSQKDLMSIPEYGRNIQNLIGYCKTVDDKEQRQKYAERIVHLMLQMNPQSKNIAEYKLKLWTQFFIIAEFDIDVMPPNGVTPTKEMLDKKPEPLSYPEFKMKFRHYGNNVKIMINKAVEMEDGPKKQAFVVTIGSFMKLAFRNWNRDHHVSDEVIKKDLTRMSEGKLVVPEDVPLNALANSTLSFKSDNSSHHKRKKGKGKSKNYKKSNYRKK